MLFVIHVENSVLRYYSQKVFPLCLPWRIHHAADGRLVAFTNMALA